MSEYVKMMRETCGESEGKCWPGKKEVEEEKDCEEEGKPVLW